MHFPRKEQHPTQSCTFKLPSFPNNLIFVITVSGAEGRTATVIGLLRQEGKAANTPREIRDVPIYTPSLTDSFSPLCCKVPWRGSGTAPFGPQEPPLIKSHRDLDKNKTIAD